MSPAEEVKSRLDIIDIIGEYVTLKPAGANWRACCPFHEEKTPSFMVSKSKQIWHCFGCGEGGDIFAFIMKQEGIDFPEALRLLAGKAGVIVKAEPPAVRTERERVLKTMEVAVSFWSAVLWNSALADKAKKYLLEERKLTEATIRSWKLGYAPDSWEALVNAMLSKGYNDEDLIKTGVAVRKMESRGRRAYDRFRNRLMFPISDSHGRLIGATGRVMPESKSGEISAEGGSASGGKYVNTPETILYHKGSVLYGLDRAKQEIKKLNLAVIVEGNVDVIMSHQVGVINVIGASGTALTSEQCNLLRRYTDRAAFCFDADAAGEAAALRGFTSALSAGFTVLIVELPKRADGTRFKDPDECIRENPELWTQAIKSAEPIIDRLLRRASENFDLKKLDQKQTVVKTLLPVIAIIQDKVAESHYLKQLSELVGVPEEHLRDSMKKIKTPSPELGRPAAKDNNKTSRDQLTILSERFLSALLKEPAQISYAMATVDPAAIAFALDPLYREMIVYYTKSTQDQRTKWSDEAFRAHLLGLPEGTRQISNLDVLQLLADKDFFEYSPVEFERDLVATAKRLRILYLKRQLSELEQSIREVERTGHEPTRLAELMAEFKRLSAELLHIDQSS